jgi:hypothetical protein
MAGAERHGEQGVIARELVLDKEDKVINNPDSIRAMYLRLKAHFKATIKKVGWLYFLPTNTEAAMERMLARANPKAPKGRVRFTEPAPARANTVKKGGIAKIEKPLRTLYQKFPGTPNERNELELHPIYAKAQRLANAGKGAELQTYVRQQLAL